MNMRDKFILDKYMPIEYEIFRQFLWAIGYEQCYYKSEFMQLAIAFDDFKKEALKPFIPLVEWLNNFINRFKTSKNKHINFMNSDFIKCKCGKEKDRKQTIAIFSTETHFEKYKGLLNRE